MWIEEGIDIEEEEAYELLHEYVTEGKTNVEFMLNEYLEELNEASEGEYAVLEAKVDVGRRNTDEFDNLLLELQIEYGVSPLEATDEEWEDAVEQYIADNDVDEEEVQEIVDDPHELYAGTTQYSVYTSQKEDGSIVEPDKDFQVRLEGGEKPYYDEVREEFIEAIEDKAGL